MQPGNQPPFNQPPFNHLPLSARLVQLRGLMRTHVHSHQRPSIDACRELIDRLTDMAEMARALERRADDAEALEAVARDLDLIGGDLIAHARSGEMRPAAPEPQGLPAISGPPGKLVDLRDVLAREQRALQARLDAEDTAHPATKGRAEAAHARGQGPGEVMLFLWVRHQPHDGGDAA